MALLAQQTGTLRLSVSEPDTKINIDGRDVAPAEVAQPLRLKPGRHAIAIAKPDFDLYTTSVEVEGGKEAVVDAKLKAEVKTGHVRVTAPAVTEGSVVVDNKEVGRLPWEGDLPPGQHVIDVKAPGRALGPEDGRRRRQGRPRRRADRPADPAAGRGDRGGAVRRHRRDRDGDRGLGPRPWPRGDADAGGHAGGRPGLA